MPNHYLSWKYIHKDIENLLKKRKHSPYTWFLIEFHKNVLQWKNFKKWQSHNQKRKQEIINFSLKSAIVNVLRTYITQRNLEHSLKLPLITPNWINLQNGRNQSCFKISCNNNSINNLIPLMVQSPLRLPQPRTTSSPSQFSQMPFDTWD
jgi:hypothetical protein